MESIPTVQTAGLREQLEQFRDSHPYQHLIVKGTHWEYIASGKGKHALVLLGGELSVGETCFQTITRLEEHFRVISPSYPPAGRIRPIIEGLTAILEKEGYSRAHLFGHSLGAGVAHAYMHLQPDRVDRLVLDRFGLCTPAHVIAARLFFKLPFPLMRSYYYRNTRRLLSRPTPGFSEDQQDFFNAYLDELFNRLHTPETLMGQFRLLIDLFDHANEYGAFRPLERPGQVLLILVDDDRGFTPQERAALIAAYPGAKMHTFKQGGQLSGLLLGEEFNSILEAFLLDGE
ncbi:MAG TPA: alpha/beta hydrolase [Anaerolineaceae bacterium]|nr:alpha/beta hydrolase [Anaerolineaceae bacterium]